MDIQQSKPMQVIYSSSALPLESEGRKNMQIMLNLKSQVRKSHKSDSLQ